MKRLLPVLACVLYLSACNSTADAGVDDNTMNVDSLAVDNLVVNDTAVTNMPMDPGPNYAEEEGGIYSYVAAVSEEDRKQGTAAGKVLRYVFRGVFEGKYVLARVDDYGRTISISECSNPCRVVKTEDDYSVTRREFTPGSIIGSAFVDAFNNRLRVKREPRPSSDYYSNPSTSTAYGQSPEIQNEIVQAGSDADNALDAAMNLDANVDVVENREQIVRDMLSR